MWVKKTEEEINAFYTKPEYVVGIKVTPFNGAVLVFVILTILQMLGDLILGKSKGRFYLPADYVREKVRLSDLPSLLPGYLAVSLMSAIFLWVILKKFGKNTRFSRTYLCQKCYRVKAADKNYKCECGGEYIEIDMMKWIEDKDEK